MPACGDFGIAALEAAREGAVATTGFTGSRARALMQPLCDHYLFSLATGWRHSGIRIRISATAKRPLDEDVIHPAAAAIDW